VIALNSKGQSEAVIDSERARNTCYARTRGSVIYSGIITLITMSRYKSAMISPVLILIVVKKSAVHDLIEACKKIGHGFEVVRGRGRENTNFTMSGDVALKKLGVAIK